MFWILIYPIKMHHRKFSMKNKIPEILYSHLELTSVSLWRQKSYF